MANEVYNDMIGSDAESINRLISEQSSPREQLISFFHVLAAPAEANPPLAQAAVSYAMGEVYGPPEAENDLFASTLVKIVEEGQRTGRLRTDWRAGELAMLLGAVFSNALWAWTAIPSERLHSDCLKRCVDTCFDGIAASADHRS